MIANMETLSSAWAGWAVAASWQIALLVVLVAIAAFLSRRLSARFRYLLWMLVIVKALTPPSLGAFWSIGNWAEPRWGEVSVTIAAEPRLGVTNGIPAEAGTPKLQQVPTEAGTPELQQVPAKAGTPELETPPKLQTPAILLLVWLGGFVVLASFIIIRYWRLTRVLSRAAEADEGPLRVMLEKLALSLNRANPPDLLLSDAVTSPFLFGLLKPRIVLPADLPNQLSSDQLEDVLLHELIHWRRRDLLSGWLQILAQALFWFHPLVWFAGAQLRHERECACDEAALESGCSQARRYGESLLKVLLAARGRSAVAMGFLGIFERNTRLQSRLEEIMNQETRVRRLKWWGWLSLAVFAILCLPMAALSQNGGERGAFTPLHMAAQNGHLGTVKLLIEKGADVNARSETGLTPLHLAAQGGHGDTAAALIAAGADINAKDNNGNTPLTFASEKGHQQLVDNLINQGADVNPKWTPRPTAANDTEWVDKLTNNQRLFMQWTDRQFDRFLDRRDFSKWQQVDRDELLKKSLNTVGGPQTREYYEAINTLGAIGDKRAVPALLKIANDRVGQDCRDNWMAARSLGMIGDTSAVPDLIHLTYHTNTNVHFWAQISLVRLTGQNFGYDWKKWGEWWNGQGGRPQVKFEKIRWWNDSKFDEASTPEALAKADYDFLNKYFPGQVSVPPTAVTPSAMPSSAAVSKKAAWSALQATGEPDTDQAGDIPTAWASLDPDMGEQWLELDFANPPSIATMVRIHETLNPGAVTKVILKNLSGSHETILTEIPVDDKTAAAPAFLEVPIQGKYAPNRVRIVLDTNKVRGWNEIDAVELVGADRRVWAGDARASSSYADRMAQSGASSQTTAGKPNWSALQATGAPDTMQAGDIPTAWASYETDQGEQWLELDYNPPLRANMVRIHETFNPGAVTRVIVKENSSPSAKVLADVAVDDKTAQAPAFLEVPFKTTSSPAGCVRVVMDTNKVRGWNEIDAVELVGPDARAWASDARASSSFADRFSSQATSAPAPPEARQSGPRPEFKLSTAEEKLLNENQAAYVRWTQQVFANVLDQSRFVNAPNKAELEQKWIATLQGPESKEFYEAINGLVAIKSKNAQPALLKVAAERVQKDNRNRWMAVRALGLVGDKSCVPELIHLTYHYNQNTRFWAQISLARLTGQNFGADWKKWGEWWIEQDGKPPFDPTPVQWATSAEMRQYMDPAKQREDDAGIAEEFKSQVSRPQILSITPRIGQTDVDPDAVHEIVVTFDCDMGGGFSWTGGGPDFPQSRNNQAAFWRDKRTCVKPVTLEAGRYYRLGINSSGYQNFKSVDGVPAEPVSVYFTTKGAAPDLVAKMQKPQVVSMNPPNGAKDVDPNTRELTVTFNVPMGGGFSWCGGGPHYPEGSGARWSEDRKTCTLSVKLKPEWEYSLYLNSGEFQNFMSEAGIPLEPVEYTFRTKAK